jgi:hypothetical protein
MNIPLDAACLQSEVDVLSFFVFFLVFEVLDLILTGLFLPFCYGVDRSSLSRKGDGGWAAFCLIGGMGAGQEGVRVFLFFS